MNVTLNMQPSTTSQLKHTAAEWFTRSQSERFGEDERVRLQDWLADDPEHFRAFNEARSTWQAMEGLRGDPDLMAEVAPRRSWLSGQLAIAASVAVMAVGLALGWQFGLFDGGVYTTEPWEHRTVRLADGSTVMLSANTVVEDTTDETHRGAVVRRGEAIFDVVTDKQNPFIVRAADAEIVVTGTRFQVRHDAGKVAVTLIEGRVRVERAPLPSQTTNHKPQSTNTPHASRLTPHVLQPGQQLAFAETSDTAELREVDVDAVTAWSRNRLVFRDAPLAEALREANRHSDLKLILEDPTLADIRVNGHFRLGDNESLLAAVRGSFPIQAYRVDKDEIVLTRAR